MDEPRPLSDDDRDPLARLVRHARGLEVAYDVETGLARHTAAIAGGARPWSTTGGGSGWGVGVGVVAIAAVAAGWIAMRPPEATPVAIAVNEERRTIDAAPEPVAVVASAAIAPTPTVAPIVAPELAPPSRPPVPARGVSSRSRPVAPRVASATIAAPAPTAAPAPEPDATPSADDRIAREAAQIRQLRTDLAEGRAAAVLRGCDAGDREFADGVFALEREGLRVLGLFALGRRDEATTAATRYLDAHPEGPLAAKIRAALAR